jgi:hypothetical protein
LQDFSKLSFVTPPSVLPDISPSRGEIELSWLLSTIFNVAERKLPTKLPISPLEGEMSGRTEGGVTKLNFEKSCKDRHALSFAAINAHSSSVVYFLHNGCVLPRVAFAPAKALNAPSQTQGEKP